MSSLSQLLRLALYLYFVYRLSVVLAPAMTSECGRRRGFDGPAASAAIDLLELKDSLGDDIIDATGEMP